jgi:hypothetical protein
VPGIIPVGDERFRAGDPLLLKRPDRSELRTTIGSLEVLDSNPSNQVVVLLKELGKKDVPIGTEVWSVCAACSAKLIAGLMFVVLRNGVFGIG